MKIKISKSQWEDMGKKAGWVKIAMTHQEISKLTGLARPCNSNDLITVSEGLQCGNCLAITRDHGKTWEKGTHLLLTKNQLDEMKNNPSMFTYKWIEPKYHPPKFDGTE